MSISTLCKSYAARINRLSTFGPRLFTIILLLSCITSAVNAQNVAVTATNSGNNASYTTLALAFAAVNAGTHTGAVVVSISGVGTTETGPCVLNSSGAGSASYTSLLIRPVVDGVIITGPTTTGRGLIELNGADNVTIDGDNPNTSGINRNLTINNTAAATITYTSCIRSATSTLVTTADNNTIKNCNLNGSSGGLSSSSASTTQTYTCGIMATNGASTTAATTAPSAIASNTVAMASGQTALNFTVTNNAINKCNRGIYFQGAATTVCPTLTITNNIIGNPVAAPTSADQVLAFGITASGFGNGTTNSVISGNTIYLESWYALSLKAIDLGGVSAQPGANLTVSNNQILRVYSHSTSQYGAMGIFVSTTTAAANITVQNNFITNCLGVYNNPSAAFPYASKGIYLATGTGHKVYHNTVNFYGPPLAAGGGADFSACFVTGAASVTGIDVRNNIFSNTLSGTVTGSKDMCILLWGGLTSTANNIINNNVCYVGSGANNVLAGIGTSTTSAPSTTYTLVNFNPAATTPATNFRAYTSGLTAGGTNDNATYASANAAPFTSNTDLHVIYTAGEATNNISNKGANLSVATDIDGDSRPYSGATLPCIGADEFQYIAPAIPTITSYAPSIICAAGGQTITITGTNFTSITAVKFNAVNATSYTVVSPTSITAVTPSGVSAGTITVSNAAGTGTSSAYTVTANPTISSQPAAASATIIPSSSASFTVATAASSPTYQWQYSTATTGPWTNVANGVGGLNYTGGTSATLTATTTVGASNGSANYFQCIVTSGGCDVTSNSAQLTLSGGYCIPTNTTNTAYYLSSFTTTGGATNLTTAVDAGFSPSGYGNFTGIAQTISGLPGASIGFTIVETGGTSGFGIWVDWNADGDFADAGETMYLPGSYQSSATSSFLIPSTAGVGSYRMRVMGQEAGSSTPSPCIGTAYTECEDYTISVLAPPAPTITSFTPNTNLCNTGGQTITITGTNFTGVTAVRFNGVNAASYTIVSTTSITAVSPGGITGGTISVTNGGGTATSSGSYTTQPGPAITTQPSGTSVTVYTSAATATFTMATSASSPTYQWYYSTSASGPWTAVANNTPLNVTYTGNTTASLSVAVSAAAFGGTYYYECIATSGACGATTTPVSLVINGYCANTNTTNTAYYVNSFTTTGALVNISPAVDAGFSPNGYGNFLSSSVSQIQGGTVNFSIAEVGGTMGYGIWVDWNSNGSFADAGEQMFQLGTYAASATGSFAVPSGQAAGNYRMRVVGIEAGTSTAPACVGSTFTECEDYTFTVATPPSCLPPTSSAATAVTGTTATANWTGGTGSYVIEYGVTGFTPGTGAAAGTGGTVITALSGATSAPIAGLNPATSYDYYVRQVCSGPAYSFNTSVQTFTTTCVAVAPPYAEGFEGITVAGNTPICMLASPVSSTSGKTRTYTAAATGTNAALAPRTGNNFAAVYYLPNAAGYFFSAPLTLTAGTLYKASVYFRTDGVAWPTAGLYLSTAQTTGSITSTIASVSSALSSSAYTQITGNFTVASSGTYYVSFGADNTTTNSPNYMAFDDFTVDPVPNCSGTPTAGTATISTTGAVCVGTNTTVSLAGYTTGVGGIGIQWQSKPAGSGSFANISGATTASYIDAPTAGTDYRAVVTCSFGGSPANSNTVTQLVNNPTITGTGGPSSVCGPAAVTLTATTSVSTDTAYWFADNVTTTNIGKGASFLTPTITATTTFYVAAQSAGGGTVAGGLLSTTGAAGGFNIAGEGLVFNATSAFTLVSVDMYPQGASTATIQVQNSSGVLIPGLTANYTFSGATSTPITVPLGFNIPVGTGYRLILTSMTPAVNFWRESSATYPFALGTVGSITSGYISGTSSAYYFFYNLKVSSGCTGSRTPVTVTYNTPPSLTVTPSTGTLCTGDSITLVATGASYPTLTWTPAGTLDVSTGTTVKAKPTNSTDYVVTGTGASGGCTNSFTVHIDLKSTPTKPSMVQHATTLCAGSSVKLKVAGVSLLDTLTTQDFNSGLNGWTVTSDPASATASNWTRITAPYSFAGTSAPDFVSYGVTTPFTPYMHANSDAGGSGSHTYTNLTSITFPTIGYSSMKLYYQHNWQFYTAVDSCIVKVSTDGTNWTYVKVYTGANSASAGTSGSTHPTLTDSVDLTSYVGNANLQVRFYYTAAWGYSWTLDNVFVTGSNSQPAYVWTPSTGLFNDAACTVPYTGTGRDSVYAKPTVTTNYKATVTNATTGCSNNDTVTISVNNPATAVANASGNASITNAATYTLTGSATNYASYSWSATGAGAFTGTGTLSPTYDPAVGQIGNVTVTLTVNALSPCASPVVSTMVLTITPSPNNVWIGNTSDWFTVSNWASGVVPNSCGAIAIIPTLTAGFVYPVINATSPQIGNISLANGASITLNAGKTLSVCGTWTGGSTTIANVLGTGAVIFNGSTAQSVTGKTSFNTLTVSKTAGTLTFSGSEDIHTALIMTQGNVVNSGATGSAVTLKSDATGTAYLDNFTSGTAGTWTGNLTVERYTGTNTSIGYRDLSSPVNARVLQWMDNFSITGLDGVNCWYAYNPYPSLQYYSESTNSVTADYYGGFISSTDQANILTAAKGYAARLYTLPSTINTTGTPNTGAQSISITKTPSSIPSADGWNLVGNPYPSPISWNAVKTANPGKTDGSVYRFTATGEYTGNYATWNGTTGTNGATDQIASTEGFWVLASATNPLNFTNAVRVAGTTAPFFKTNTAQADEIRLILSNGANSDEIVSYTDPNTTAGYEPGYDAAKMAAGSTVYMSFDMPAKEMAINVMDQIGILTELPLKIAVQDSGAYTLTATELNLTGLTAYLKDAASGTYTDLSAGPVTLVLTPGHYYAGQYSVVFKTKTTGPTGIATTTTEPSVKIYSYDGKVYVIRSSNSAATVNISNLLGQQVADIKTSEEKTIIPMTVTEPWYALVKVTEGSKVTVEKVLISNK